MNELVIAEFVVIAIIAVLVIAEAYYVGRDRGTLQYMQGVMKTLAKDNGVTHKSTSKVVEQSATERELADCEQN
jgi:Na+/H+ antiporter NhaC